MLLNLIMNGIEAMADAPEPRGRMTITAEPHTAGDGSGVLVAVKDTGVAVENLHRLFEAFYTTKAPGLEMGLSISRSIADAHGGRLCSARNGGFGTTFQLTLPAAGRPEP